MTKGSALIRDPSRPKFRLRRPIKFVTWAYLIVVAIAWATVRFAGDRWWPATLMLFGPLWIFMIPGMILIPAALVFRRRSLGILLVAQTIAAFPLAGLCIPFRTWFARPATGQVVRLMTCNVNEHSFDENALAALVAEARPDVILLQEWPRLRNTALRLEGMRYFHHDSESELYIASRFPIRATADFTDPNWADFGGSATRYDLDTPAGPLHLFNLHLASPHLPFQAVIDAKPSATARVNMHLAVRSEQSQRLSDVIEKTGPDALVAGDFNTLCQGAIYHQYWSRFTDAFSTAGLGLGHTYFAEGAAVRIDHVMMGNGWKCRRCRVGASVGSPHHPVIAELERIGQ